MAVLSRNPRGVLTAAELPTDDVQEHLEAVKEAGDVLRDWRAGRLAKPAGPESDVPTPNPRTLGDIIQDALLKGK
jgi:hypothetical protein